MKEERLSLVELRKQRRRQAEVELRFINRVNPNQRENQHEELAHLQLKQLEKTDRKKRRGQQEALCHLCKLCPLLTKRADQILREQRGEVICEERREVDGAMQQRLLRSLTLEVVEEIR